MLLLDFHDEPNATGHSIQQQDGAILMMVQPIKDINEVKIIKGVFSVIQHGLKCFRINLAYNTCDNTITVK